MKSNMGHRLLNGLNHRLFLTVDGQATLQFEPEVSQGAVVTRYILNKPLDSDVADLRNHWKQIIGCDLVDKDEAELSRIIDQILSKPTVNISACEKIATVYKSAKEWAIDLAMTTFEARTANLQGKSGSAWQQSGQPLLYLCNALAGLATHKTGLCLSLCDCCDLIKSRRNPKLLCMQGPQR